MENGKCSTFHSFSILNFPFSIPEVPLIHHSTYRRSPLLPGSHLETIVPTVFRRVDGVDYERERIDLPDGDFLDLDWLDGGHRRLVLLTHGLEGDTGRQYVRGMAKIFHQKKWDVLAWNCRSCSGEMNRAQRMYHHGDIADIGEVIAHALHTKDYGTVVLSGFSMGANISMKFLGVHGREVPEPVRAAVVFSAPTDLRAGAEILDRPENFIYYRRFLFYLKQKIVVKNQQYPGVIDLENFKKIKVWRDFDEYFSAPLNGFRDAADFYEKSSPQNFMAGIAVPTLLVQALNDPILPPVCYPKDLCEKHPHLYLEMPRHGGHVGFWHPGKEFAWSERRAVEFVEGKI
ncbi:MAG: alpha/beta fold hydrolase [Bacteroidetes bacterium]|nr:alpha/beta fold hydrolase [Bacteroidota bacterium]